MTDEAQETQAAPPTPEEAEEQREDAGTIGKVPGEGDVPGNPPGDPTPGTDAPQPEETVGDGPSGGGDETGNDAETGGNEADVPAGDGGTTAP